MILLSAKLIFRNKGLVPFILLINFLFPLFLIYSPISSPMVHYAGYYHYDFSVDVEETEFNQSHLNQKYTETLGYYTRKFSRWGEVDSFLTVYGNMECKSCQLSDVILRLMVDDTKLAPELQIDFDHAPLATDELIITFVVSDLVNVTVMKKDIGIWNKDSIYPYHGILVLPKAMADGWSKNPIELRYGIGLVYAPSVLDRFSTYRQFNSSISQIAEQWIEAGKKFFPQSDPVVPFLELIKETSGIEMYLLFSTVYNLLIIVMFMAIFTLGLAVFLREDFDTMNNQKVRGFDEEAFKSFWKGYVGMVLLLTMVGDLLFFMFGESLDLGLLTSSLTLPSTDIVIPFVFYLVLQHFLFSLVVIFVAPIVMRQTSLDLNRDPDIFNVKTIDPLEIFLFVLAGTSILVNIQLNFAFQNFDIILSVWL